MLTYNVVKLKFVKSNFLSDFLVNTIYRYHSADHPNIQCTLSGHYSSLTWRGSQEWLTPFCFHKIIVRSSTRSTSCSCSQNRAIPHVHYTRAQSPSSTTLFPAIFRRKEESFFFKNSTKLVCSSSLLKYHHVFQVIVAAKKYGKAECNSRF